MDSKLRFQITGDNRDAKASLEEVDRIIDRLGKRSTSVGTVFKGVFGANVATEAARQFQAAAVALKGVTTEMTRLSAERQNALRGLESLSSYLQIDSSTVQQSLRSLRLVRTGIVQISDASIALRNLLSAGFSLQESIKLFETFSDTAAFGKSAALDFGEAIKGATEGIKNGNSVLVDNVGLTKNLSAILKDAGFAEQDLAKAKDDVNVRQALFNGLIKEALPQLGDADKLTTGWTGSVAALTTAKQNLYATIGDIITQNPELLALIRAMTAELNGNTDALTNNEKQARSTFSSYVSWAAKASLSMVNFADSVTTTFTAVGQAVAAALSLAVATASAQLSAFPNLVNQFVVEPINAVKNSDVMRLINPLSAMVPDIPKLSTTNDITKDYALRTKFLMQDVQKTMSGLHNRNLTRNENFARELSRGGTLGPSASTTGRDPITGSPLGPRKVTGGTGSRSATSSDQRSDKQAYQAFVAELKKLGVTINSGFRTFAQQASLYKRLPKGQAARPGTSDHEFWKAVDLPPNVSDEILQLAAQRAGVTLGKRNVHQGTGLHNHQSFRKGRSEGGGEADIAQEMKERAEQEKKAAEEQLENARRMINAQIEERTRATDFQISEIERLSTIALLTEEDASLMRMKVEEELQAFRVTQLTKYADAAEGSAEQRAAAEEDLADAEHNLAIMRSRNESERVRLADARWEKRMDQIRAEITAEQELYQTELDRRDLERQRVMDQIGDPPEPGADADGRGQWQKTYDWMLPDDDAAVAGLNAMQAAFEGLSGAINTAVQAWILYGSAGQSARQVAAQVIAAVAQMATVKALFELAEGFAALARSFFGDPTAAAQAALHFKSAATYGAIAGIAAIAGRGVAGDSFKQGGTSGSESGAGSGGGQQSQDLQPVSRYSDSTFISGRGTPWQQAVEVFERLEKKISSMRPGDVLTAASRQNPGIVAATATKEMRSNHSLSTAMNRTMGNR